MVVPLGPFKCYVTHMGVGGGVSDFLEKIQGDLNLLHRWSKRWKIAFNRLFNREVATAFVSSFADDTRAANGISTNADVCDLQVDLDAIYHWADEKIWNSTTQSLNVYDMAAIMT